MHPATSRLPTIRASGFRRLLLVRPDNIGDVLMLSPAVRALRDAAPGARITLLASPAGAQAAPLLPWIDEVLEARVSWQQLASTSGSRPASAPDDDRALIERLARGRFDAAFVFTSFSQSPWPAAYACLLAGIPVRVGRVLGFGGALLTHAADPLPEGTHQVERSLDLLEAVGIPVADRRLQARIPEPARTAACDLLRGQGIERGDPYVVFAPGASCDARRIPAALAAAVSHGLADASPHATIPVVLVGGPGDVASTTSIAGEAHVRSLVGRTTIPELAAVIAGARAVVTAHSLPMHLADATGTPVVVAFSGTDRESEWAPRDVPARLLRRETACAPCRFLTCPIGMPCLDLDPDAVVGAVRDLLGARAPDAGPAQRRSPAVSAA